MPEILNSLAIGAPPTGKLQPRERVAPGAPTIRNEQPGSPVVAPVTRTASQTDPDAPPFPLNHARILYVNALAGSSVSASTGTGAANVLNPATYSRWTFTGPAQLTITLPTATPIDAVGLGAHNFANASALVEWSASDAGSWVQFAPAQTGRASMLFLSDSAVSAKRIRVTITGSGSLVLGVVSAGVALQMQRPIYKGHEPGTLSRVTEYQSTESEGGQWLGRNVIRQGLKTAYNWRNLSAAWLRQYFDPFVDAARSSPFFIAWNPLEFPREVVYAWTTGDVAPSNAGPRDLMSATVNVRGAV